MADDADLLDAWAEGDQASGRELFHRHADRLTDFIARKTDRDVADLVQRAFMQCLQTRKERGVRIDNPRAYLYRVVRNDLYDRLASGRRLDPAVTSLAELAPGPRTMAARSEMLRRLLVALRKIPLDDQLVLELHYWEGLAMVEVAEVLGLSRTAAISRVHRARAKVRDALQALGASDVEAEHTVTNFEAWQKRLRSYPASPVNGAAPGSSPGEED